MPTAQSAFARAALHGAGFTFRPATLADVRWTAELQTAREPDEPANEEQLRHWWQFHDREHIEITTIDVVADPEKWRKLHAMCEASIQDIPTTVPHAPESFESFMKWMSSPGMHADRLWIAREGTAIVGMSVLEYPPGVGNVWTDYTGTARSVRGRGIARALKSESVSQAAALGVTRVRTNNDGENKPILHLNEEMGYHRIRGFIQLLKQAPAG